MAKIFLIASLACLASIAVARNPYLRGAWCGTGWSASIVPDSAPMPSIGGVPMCNKTPVFGPSCQKHDLCYDTCGTTQQKCDDDFLTNLKAGCEAQQHESKLCSGYCSMAATLYFKAVQQFGAGAFKQAQEVAKCKGK